MCYLLGGRVRLEIHWNPQKINLSNFVQLKRLSERTFHTIEKIKPFNVANILWYKSIIFINVSAGFFSLEKIKKMGESLWNNGGQIVLEQKHTQAYA